MTVSLDYDEYDLGSMTWEDADETLEAADMVVLPTGSIEQHSKHLPVTVDTLRAESLTQELVEAASERGLSMVRLPTLPYGYSEHHMPFSGTITLGADTYQAVLEDIGASLTEHGVKRLTIVNCHGGNRPPMDLAVDRLQRDHGIALFPVHWTDFAREQLEEEFGQEWGHAGDHETSVIELFYPNLVRSDKKEPQTRKADYDARQYDYYSAITEQGGRGDPTNADPEFMRQVVDDTTERILNALESDMDPVAE